MLNVLPPPQAPEDAITLVNALGNPAVTPLLVEDYGQEPVEQTYHNAVAWMDAVLSKVQPMGYVRDGQVVDVQRDLDATLTPPLADFFADTGYRDIEEPVEFSLEQSGIILAAVRRVARPHVYAVRTHTRIEGLHYLARQSPVPVERALCRLALRKLMSPRQPHRV